VSIPGKGAERPGRRGLAEDHLSAGMGSACCPIASCPALPAQLVVLVSGRLGGHRCQIGARRGTRAPGCQKQAVFVLAWFGDWPGVRRFGNGSGISQAAACRYLHEGIDPIAVTAPGPNEALAKAIGLGPAYLIPDGEVAARRPVHREDRQQERRRAGRWSPGKAHHHGGNSRSCPRRRVSRCGSQMCCAAASTASPWPATRSCPDCART
jgi:hypothetical protein